jgi:SAM-dependent methyltransferase
MTARRKTAREGLGERIVTAHGDATNFDTMSTFVQAGFDRVFISYSLSMMPNWPEALDRAARAVAPGGRLLIVDFGQQEKLPRWFRTALFAWLERFHVYPIRTLPSSLESLAASHGLSLAVRSSLGGYAIHATLARPEARRSVLFREPSSTTARGPSIVRWVIERQSHGWLLFPSVQAFWFSEHLPAAAAGVNGARTANPWSSGWGRPHLHCPAPGSRGCDRRS